MEVTELCHDICELYHALLLPEYMRRPRMCTFQDDNDALSIIVFHYFLTICQMYSSSLSRKGHYNYWSCMIDYLLECSTSLALKNKGHHTFSRIMVNAQNHISLGVVCRLFCPIQQLWNLADRQTLLTHAPQRPCALFEVKQLIF